MTKIIVAIVFGSVMAWLFGFGITEVLITETQHGNWQDWDWSRKRKDVNRGHAYILCALIVFPCAQLIGLGLGPYLFPQHFDSFTKVFWTFVAIYIPAWIGVWSALPKNK